MRRVLVLISLIAATLVVVSAEAGPTVSGKWNGFITLDRHTAVKDNQVRLNILSQIGQRFDGEATLIGVDCLVNGTISESMHMSVNGTCEDGSRLLVETEAIDTDSSGVIPLMLFGGSWRLTGIKGNLSGLVGLLRETNGPTELVAGNWQGEIFDEDGKRG